MADISRPERSPNAMASVQSEEARVGVPTGLEPGQGYSLGRIAGKGDRALETRTSFFISLAIHFLAVLFLGMSALFSPKRPSVVPIFELVNLEKPKLRPLRPKTVKPPEPPPPEPEPVKPPEAPKLTTKPEKAVVPKKPEPKTVKEPDPEPKVVKEVVPEQQVLPQVTAHMPSDPRLSLWAARVKKKAETMWNLPAGIDILGTVTVMVNVKFLRDGTIQDVEVATSSGSPELDNLAIMAVKRMDHVPPIPANFPEDELVARIDFPYYGH